MKYLRGSQELTLSLEADDITVVKWWVDGAFATHADMQSHTGSTMSLGKGSILPASIRQKINTKSSTKAKLVAVADMMPQVLWTRHFLEAQGYKLGKSIIYQDNKTSKNQNM